MKNKTGFTLVELLAVIIILAIVLGITIPSITTIIASSKKGAFQENVKLIIKAVETKMATDSSFDATGVTIANIENELGIDSSNFEFISVSLIDNEVNIDVVGKNQWEGLEAHGTKTNLTKMAAFSPAYYTFSYTGDYQSFVVPESGIYRIEAWGASGGGDGSGYYGGNGGYAAGNITLSMGQTIYLYVGGAGKSSVSGTGGGFNGGGNAGTSGSSGAGGGASDVRINGQEINKRIIVAGGGGGDGGGDANYYVGYGGGITGANGGNSTTNGATQDSGGTSSYGNGAIFQGANHTGDGGGGGGGYYGGGAGNGDHTGGGGSSYIGGVEKGETIPGNATMPSPIGKTQVGQTGNGYIRITKVDPSKISYRYDYNGDAQVFVVPQTGTYKVEAWGASGGGDGSTSAGGRGAYVSGDIYLTAGQSLYLYIGGAGRGEVAGTGGGFNGGGNAGTSGTSGAGGGSTDIRVGGVSLYDRILVAGGGAGAGGSGTNYAGYGGLIGANGPNSSTNGATQTSGGTSANGNGTLLQGGNHNSDGGGGGGGYYGGGAGAGDYTGGGGSSFISGCSSCNAVNASGVHTGSPNHFSGYVFSNIEIDDGNAEMPNAWTGSGTGNYGNGYVRITKVQSNVSMYKYRYTGASQTFTVPQTGKYKIEVWGAAGGNDGGTGLGGYGGYASGEVTLSEGQSVYIYVGGAGQSAVRGTGGGFNGGGNAGTSGTSGAGGGATDIRINGTDLTNRIIVAGGAGGGGGYGANYSGYGGGLTGGNGYNSTTNGATQESGGTSANGNGSLLQGGNHNADGGGGGGGYYGGGAGNGDSHGGGGSSYLGGVEEGNTISGNLTMPNLWDGFELGHSGHGYARLTYLK